MRIRLALLALLCIALAPVSARAEWPHDSRTPFAAIPLGGFTAHQRPQASLPDGQGGAFVFFLDQRSGDFDVYAAHTLSDGTRDPGWPASGIPLCVAAGDQSDVRAVPDGSGGAYVAWLDPRSGTPRNYVTRMLPSGVLAAGFLANGIAFDNLSANAQHAASICVDYQGGLVGAWEYDFSPGDHDIYAGRVDPTGVLTFTGAVITSAANDVNPVIVSEQNVIALAWAQGSSSMLAARFGPFSTTLVPGITTLSSIADTSVPPRACPDGWGGSFVGFAGKVGANWQVSVVRYWGGASNLGFSSVSGLVGAVPTLGDMILSGPYNAWLVYGFASTGVSQVVRVTLEGVAGPSNVGFLTDTTQPMSLAPDGQGGVFVSHTGTPAGSTSRVYTTRRTANLLNAPVLFGALGASEGVETIRFRAFGGTGTMCADAAGGVLVFGRDLSFIPNQTWAMRVDRWGALDGAAQDVDVRDVQGDQGGHVRVSWRASYLDVYEGGFVNQYRLWRQVPVAAAQSMLAEGRPAYPATGLEPAARRASTEDAAPELAAGTVWLQESLTGTFAWELVTSQIANQFTNYSLTVPTVSDSSSAGPANTVYMVEAVSTGYSVGWPSLPDSGHSVDNIPPATPSPFAGALVGGANTQLTWGANSEGDLAGYELHRGSSAGFVPGAGTRIATLTATSYLDAAASGFYYKLAALDSHGNRSGYALVSPTGTLDAPDDQAPRVLSLALASANPALHGMSLRCALPATGRLSLAIHDVNGRLVRTLANESRAAGAHVLRWDGRDAAGAAAPSGMYFARLRTAAGERVVRFVLSH